MNRRAFLLAAAACSAIGASTQRTARAQTMPRFSEAAAYSADRGGASFLVARHGIILGEEYPMSSMNARWPVGTGTRSLMTLLMASLVEDRLLRLDEPVALT